MIVYTVVQYEFGFAVHGTFSTLELARKAADLILGYSADWKNMKVTADGGYMPDDYNQFYFVKAELDVMPVEEEESWQ